MVISCSSFPTVTECLFSINMDYNIKFTILTLLFLYSIVGIFLHKHISKEKSYMHFWAFYLTRVLSIIYIVFTPIFYLFLLNSGISLEIFITIIIAFYLIFTALFIGIAIYSGSSSIFKLFGFDDWNELKDEMKDRRSLKKYG